MQRARTILRWITAVGIVLLLTLLAFTCIDIYLDAQAADTDVLHQMYRVEDLQQRFHTVKLPFYVLSILIVLPAIIIAVLPAQNRKVEAATVNKVFSPCEDRSGQSEDKHCDAMQRRYAWQRYILLLTAIVFILLGVVNGGLYDVLVKAINICTECIGLG